ncbi:MAG: GNAT family N-acetyltransferase [Ruminococcaceae bacterium]|nr:GNAT family N-acetyltransferase [Oscillospiraceae bacterium]
MNDIKIRFADSTDAATVLYFIKELAEYEEMADLVVATEEDIKNNFFGENIGGVLILSENGRDVGFAIYFYSFSTFLGKRGIHLEDLFVLPEYRGRGYGKALLERLAEICVKEDLGRLEWNCLDWNTPSIKFYRSLGAEMLDEWLNFRLSGEALKELGTKEN